MFGFNKAKSEKKVAAKTVEARPVVATKATGLSQDEIVKMRASFHSMLLDCKEVDTKDFTISEDFMLSGINDIMDKKRFEGFIPSLPKIASELFKELESDDASMPSVTQLIRQDLSITGNLIKMANSVYFNPAGAEISTINHAISLVGLSRLKALVMSAMLEDEMLTESVFFKQFGVQLWAHCLQTAHLCRIVSKKDYNSMDYEAHYLMGLMHDTGKIIVFNIVNKIMIENPHLKEPSPHFMYKVMNDFAPILTIELSKKWKLPEALIHSISEQQLNTLNKMTANNSKILYIAHLLTTIHNLLSIGSLAKKDAGEALESEGINAEQFNNYFKK
jgi:HD-like signal output (HDOD) protein